MSDSAIRVWGARTHNLKGIDCRVPHGKLTVVTGPSGAGKSSLAFDTIFAEGQRRFVESMSTYARQFLEQMERPPVEELRNVLPPVALEARNSVRNARSTVGTVTEIQDVLRLLFTHLGEVHCPQRARPVQRCDAEEVGRRAGRGRCGRDLSWSRRCRRPLRRPIGRCSELVRLGFARVLGDGEVERLAPTRPGRPSGDPTAVRAGRFTCRRLRAG